jgi:formamidopyrimidine-DNA glycosylase
MPELPEVETIVRELRPRLTGRHIAAAEILHPRIARFCREDISAVASGRRIEEVLRHGKFILLRLDRGWMTIHLGMTGKILFDSPRGPHMLYDDPRMFGSIEWSAEPVRTARLGPDAFASGDLPPDLLRRRTPIKAALLNQSVFSGIGNIYADEALFRAGIHPRRRADRLSPARAAKLVQVIREVMVEAVEGRPGGFQERHNVYGREGLPCRRCGAPVRKIVLAGRGTHYCPKCQR